MEEIFENYYHWDNILQMQRVTKARVNMNRTIRYADDVKDVLFLDLALESYTRSINEKMA